MHVQMRSNIQRKRINQMETLCSANRENTFSSMIHVLFENRTGPRLFHCVTLCVPSSRIRESRYSCYSERHLSWNSEYNIFEQSIPI